MSARAQIEKPRRRPVPVAGGPTWPEIFNLSITLSHAVHPASLDTIQRTADYKADVAILSYGLRSTDQTPTNSIHVPNVRDRSCGIARSRKGEIEARITEPMSIE
jgi:hypothetical protein